jgi:hypothetical protein
MPVRSFGISGSSRPSRAPFRRVPAGGGADVGGRFGLDQAPKGVLQDRPQRVGVGSGQLVKQVGGWHAGGGHARLLGTWSETPKENPAVAFLVYSPPGEPATWPLHHSTGRYSCESSAAASAPEALAAQRRGAVHRHDL